MDSEAISHLGREERAREDHASRESGTELKRQRSDDEIHDVMAIQ